MAKHVLEGKTQGYRNHPQLDRFKKARKPLDAINQYLGIVYTESLKRGYHFDSGKFTLVKKPLKLRVARGQLNYEFGHLLSKLKVRYPKLYKEVKKTKKIESHSLFKVVKGEIEDWEIIKK